MTRPLPSTAIRHDYDGRNWDYRDQIEPPPAYRRATWLFRFLIAAFIVAVIAAIVSAP